MGLSDEHELNKTTISKNILFKMKKKVNKTQSLKIFNAVALQKTLNIFIKSVFKYVNDPLRDLKLSHTILKLQRLDC